MRTCLKTLNFAVLPSLIEEAQTLGNRMESALEEYGDISTLEEDIRKLREARRALKKEVKELIKEREGIYTWVRQIKMTRYIRLTTGKVVHIVQDDTLIKSGFVTSQRTMCGIRYNPAAYDIRPYFPGISNQMKFCSRCIRLTRPMVRTVKAALTPQGELLSE